MMATTPALYASCWKSSRPTENGRGAWNQFFRLEAIFFRRECTSIQDSMLFGQPFVTAGFIGVPLAWFPRLLHSAPEQREQVRISSRGLHWEALDEDISIAGLCSAGEGDQTTSHKTFAA